MSLWGNDQPEHGPELRAAAMKFAEHSWPVMPGTFWQGGRWWGQRNAPQTDLVPVLAEGVAGASTDPDRIAAWWSRRPYSVLLATGSVLDVIELSAGLGRRVHAALRSAGVTAPVAATPTGRWWIAVAAGEPLRPELAARAGVALHSRGSWVAAPPSASAAGQAHWRVLPSAGGWRLPDPYDVQCAVLETLAERPTLPTWETGPLPVVTGVRS